MDRQEAEGLLARLGPEVARELGWSLVPREDITHGVELEAPEGYRVFMSVGYQGGYGKVHVSGSYPRDAKGRQGHLPYGKRYPEIYVSVTRPAKAVASEIARRFVPEWEPLWREMVRSLRSQVEYEEQKREGAERLAAIVGVDRQEIRDGKFSLYRSEAFPEDLSDVEVHGDEARLELRCSVDLAEEILRFLVRKAGR